MPATLDEQRLNALLLKMVGDLGAFVHGSLVVTGDRLGLYKTLAEHGPMTAAELAAQTETHVRYVEEWLAAQAASGYVEYDAKTQQFFMTPEQVAVLGDDESSFAMAGGFYSAAAVARDEPKLTEAFRSGKGLSWGDHDACLFCGTAKFFRPNYQRHLVAEWIPALNGVAEALKGGARVADVGCGFGLSTIILAKTYPRSEFVGFDFHVPSIERARTLAADAGLTNVSFQVATAKDYPGKDYDLVTFFDSFHDMGDPVGAATHVRSTLKPDGTWMLVEPFAHDALENNLNLIGRVYYGFSTAVCTPSALSQNGGIALGAQAGETRLREVAAQGGFSRFRRATETPFNMILEAKP